jgi:Tetratricopeptide repeat./Uncharacterized protein conserved in bacteria (DUF2225).
MATNKEKKFEQEWAKLAGIAARAVEQNKYDHGLATWKLALEEAQQYGEVHSKLAYTLEKIAECYWFQRDFAHAAEYCAQALHLYETILGEEHLDVATIAGNLALLCHTLEDFNEAERNYRRAIQIKTNILGAKHPEVLKLTGTLAELMRSQGRYQELVELEATASLITSKGWSATSSYRPFSAKSFGSPRLSQSERKAIHQSLSWHTEKDKAEEALKQGDHEGATAIWLNLINNLKDISKPNYCFALERLGKIAEDQKDYPTAEEYLRQAYDMKVAALGKNHVSVAGTANRLAELYYSMCDYDRAEMVEEHCVQTYQKALGSNPVQLAEALQQYCLALQNLGTLYHVQRKYEHADTYYRKAIALKTQLFGEEHKDTEALVRKFQSLQKDMQKQQIPVEQDPRANQMISGTWKIIEKPLDDWSEEHATSSFEKLEQKSDW